MLLDGLECLGGEAQLDEALAGLPPQLLVLQVHELLLLRLVVGEGHLVRPVRLLVGEGAHPAWMKKNHTKLHHLSNQTIISLIVLLVVGNMQVSTLLMDVNFLV